jgi:hypothetical protein
VDLFNFIFRLGVVFAIFGFLWSLFQLGYILLRGGSTKSTYEEYTLKGLKYFFLVQVTFIFCIDSGIVQIPRLILAGLILLTYFIGKIQNQKYKKVFLQFTAGSNPKADTNFSLKAEIVIICLSLLVFFSLIAYPGYAHNQLSNWFHESIENIDNTPIFGFIFKVIGFFFVLGLVGKMMRSFTLILSGKLMNQARPSENKEKEDRFDDFEELE